MEAYWFLATMSRFAISLASLIFFFFSDTLHNNLPFARAKQLSRSMKKKKKKKLLCVRKRQSYSARPHR